jgi:hypothetical protein
MHQLASFDRDHLIKHCREAPFPDPESRLTATEVETLTFDTLLSRYGLEHVDVLQVDTEGYDLQILRQFDIPRRLPAIVQYEHKHLSRPDREAAAEILVGSGYRLAVAGFDTVAYRL